MQFPFSINYAPATSMSAIYTDPVTTVPAPPTVPVFAVDLVCGQSVVEHEHLVRVLQSGSSVVLVLQLHRCIQQGQVAANDESVRAVYTNTKQRQH